MFFVFIQFVEEDVVSLWNIIGSVAVVFPGGFAEQPHCCKFGVRPKRAFGLCVSSAFTNMTSVVIGWLDLPT